MQLWIFLKNTKYNFIFSTILFFLEVAALTNGEIVNYSSIASDCGVSAVTVKEYFSILQDTLIGYLIPAYRDFAEEHPDCRKILVSRDIISRREGDIELIYFQEFLRRLWNEELF